MSHEHEFEYENQEMTVPTQSSSQSRSRKGCVIFGLLVALVVFALLYSMANIGSGRLSGGSGSFDASSYAYPLAQQVEQYRRVNQDSRNYCLVALFLEDTNGTITTGSSHVFAGSGSTIENHCEQVSLRWVKLLVLPKLPMTNLRAIHVVLFSQVRVCKPCQPTFDTWQADLQQAVPQNVSVDLSVFEIRPGSPSGFNPSIYPKGPYTSGPAKPGTAKPVPVRPQDINRVR